MSDFSVDCNIRQKPIDTIGLSEEARAKIMRCLSCGENPYTVLTYAAECIGKLSGDVTFGERCRKAIGAVYAEGLADPQAAALKRQELSERRERIKSALWNTSDSDTRERLINSVRHIDTELKKLDIIIEQGANRR